MYISEKQNIGFEGKSVHVEWIFKFSVGNSLLPILKLRFGRNAKLLFRLWAQDFEVEFKRDFEAEVSISLLMFGLNLDQDYEARFGQDFKFKFSLDTDVCLRFWS